MAKPQCGHLRLLYATSSLSLYESRMIARVSHSQPLPRAVTLMALLVLGFRLGGCADMSDSMTSAFADPAKYDFYDCKQLETERKSLGVRSAELQGLMAKAETGVAGSVVSELAYRNDYGAARPGQTRRGGLAPQQMPSDSARSGRRCAGTGAGAAGGCQRPARAAIVGPRGLLAAQRISPKT